MYCLNCGVELQDGTRYCHVCGASNSSEKMKVGGLKSFTLASVIITGFLILMMFFKWFEMPPLFAIYLEYGSETFDEYDGEGYLGRFDIDYTNEFSMFDLITNFSGIIDIGKEIDRYDDEQVYNFNLVIIFLLVNIFIWLATLLFFVLYMNNTIKRKGKGTACLSNGIIIIMVLAVLDILCMQYFKKSLTELFGSSDVKIKTELYILFLCALMVKVWLIPKVDIESEAEANLPT